MGCLRTVDEKISARVEFFTWAVLVASCSDRSGVTAELSSVLGNTSTLNLKPETPNPRPRTQHPSPGTTTNLVLSVDLVA